VRFEFLGTDQEKKLKPREQIPQNRVFYFFLQWSGKNKTIETRTFKQPQVL